MLRSGAKALIDKDNRRETASHGVRAAGWRASALQVDYSRCDDDDDLGFLESVYVSTRAEEVAATGWPDEVQRLFLRQQFLLQHRHYRQHYKGAEWLLVNWRGVPVGRLYLAFWPGELRVADIALLPEARGQGIGSAILEDLIDEAQALGLAVSVHVERNNPARSLYARLGFARIGEHGIYDQMRREPAGDQLNTAS